MFYYNKLLYFYQSIQNQIIKHKTSIKLVHISPVVNVPVLSYYCNDQITRAILYNVTPRKPSLNTTPRKSSTLECKAVDCHQANMSNPHAMALGVAQLSLQLYILITLFSLEKEVSLLFFSLQGCITSGSPSGFGNLLL